MVQLHSDHTLPNRQQWRLEEWQQHIDAYRPGGDNELIHTASMLAQLAGQQLAADNGQSCFSLGLTMADLLLGLGLDKEVLSAAILYTTVRHGGLEQQDITEQLDESVTKLIHGTMKMDAVNELHSQVQATESHPRVDNIRKMLMAIVDDLRVVFIKLTEQVALMTMPVMIPTQRKQRMAHEALAIYAPLANRMGADKLKWLLEDLGFSLLNPEMYQYIARSLNERRIDRELFVQHMEDELEKILRSEGIQNAKVSGRAKHIYGIYRKMVKKDLPFSEIYDIYALRILVPDVDSCYRMLNAVHDRWEQVPEEFDDYIAQPKPNGYRSIHTVIKPPENVAVEVQIRTYDMHEQAEMGGAAHWAYKEAVKQSQDYHSKITWLRQLMAWQKEVTEQESNPEIYSQIFDDRVYAFTPQGEVLDLPTGATPLDFAYHIHSDVGHHCRGAKVNNKLVPLNTKLHTGDQVQIMTSAASKPSRDWLNPEEGYLTTARARAKVQQWFRQKAQEQNIIDGEAQVEKALKRHSLSKQYINELVTKMNFTDRRQLFAAVGRGEITTYKLDRLIQEQRQQQQPQTQNEPLDETELAQPKSISGTEDVYSAGIPKLLTHTASCCKPLPGDDVLGYVTQNHGISIHHRECSNLKRMQDERPQRVIEVQWGSNVKNYYPVDLTVYATEDSNITREIKNVLDREKYSLLNFHRGRPDSGKGQKILLTLEVNNIQSLNHAVNLIKQLPNVFEVKR